MQVLDRQGGQVACVARKIGERRQEEKQEGLHHALHTRYPPIKAPLRLTAP